MAAGVRDIDRRRMPGAAVAAHPPRGHPPVRSGRLRADASRPRYAARLRAHPCQPRIHSWWRLCGRLALVRDAHAAVPLWAPAIAGRSYGVLVLPFIWGLTEQMTYNGYLVPRFQVLCRSTSLAIVFVAFAWSLQHAFMPLTFDARFMAFRLLSSVPNTVFQTLLYLRLRRLVPLAIGHALMDGASVLIGVLLPLLST